jgi:hypothetical protein
MWSAWSPPRTATYEEASAATESDSYDPAANALDDQYKHLQGRSVEFTIGPDGKVSRVTGIDEAVSNPAAAAALRNWINEFSPGGNLPAEGIAVGQKWEAERPLENTPLANLLWRTASSYLRDEPCAVSGQIPSPAQIPGATSAAPFCIVILSSFDILRHGSANADATPEDYRHNGLRSAGTWTGKGQSLDTISLQTGMLLRSTQSSAQKMDFEIVSAISGSKIHYAGQVESQSEISLIPNGAATQTQP